MSLKELFKTRDDTYTKSTQDILLQLKEVVSGVHDVVGEQGEFIVWKMVEYYETDEYIMLAGIVLLPEGHVINSGGKEIVITDENRNRFTRFIRVGLPLRLAEQGTRGDIADYLRDNLEGDIEQFKDGGEFSLDELSSEQIDQMRMFSNVAKGKVN